MCVTTILNMRVIDIKSPFTELWESCSNLHLKIRPIAIFAFYSLNYSLAARLQDNSRPKSPTKVETKRKLQQFTVSGWLIINGGASDSEKRNHIQYEVSAQLPAFVCMNHYFHRLLISTLQMHIRSLLYKLVISDYKTVSNEKDMNNLFN